MQTKVMFNIDTNGNIYFECVNHSGDHDVCTIISTLCNVLIKACEMANIEPQTIDDGHVKIIIDKAEYPLVEVFRTVQATFYEAENQHPFRIKIY